MIEHIKGILKRKEPNSVIIDVGGIGYKIAISLNCFNLLPELNNELFLSTYFNVTEKNQELYGFKDINEKEIFILLISVSGIGPKIAINLLSFIKPDDFKQRLIAGEVELLTDLPGIGPKTARRIIIELKDKFIKMDKNDLPIENKSNMDSDVYSALIKLGYRSNEIRVVLNKINADLNIEDKIKEALKQLG